nr:metal-sensitive transcriptional regulator [Anaerolineae bacterium]
MHIQSEETRESIANRMKRIEGQVRGIQRMLDEHRDCRDIIQQLAAIRSAVQQAGLAVMREYAGQCLGNPETEIDHDEVVAYLIDSLSKWA